MIWPLDVLKYMFTIPASLPIGVRTGSATKISPCVTTTWEGSIKGQGSAILRISTLWKRFLSASPIYDRNNNSKLYRE